MAVFPARHFRRGSRVGHGAGWLEGGVVAVTIKELIAAWKISEPILKFKWRVGRTVCDWWRERKKDKHEKRNQD